VGLHLHGDLAAGIDYSTGADKYFHGSMPDVPDNFSVLPFGDHVGT
jgi:hypothetical protein